MKALSSVVLLTGLMISGFAQASQLPDEALNTFQLLRSYTRGYDLTAGKAANGHPCSLKFDYSVINGKGSVYVNLTAGDTEAFKDVAIYSSAITKPESVTATEIKMGDWGWEGEETNFVLSRTEAALSVKAEYTYSEDYGNGTTSDTCTFAKK
ncbi:hypothetical protein [Bdellovibrio sp. KM01]|uniref:hypothetical protein n=1 Tax=Bdellovibrio sp. KM01 TaxID=2748865 RepID=UPI0015EAE159|nr:hypothetical protein [Bdellovibrio sp. KM01]QLY23950.1 hypothetical protein HW988_10695 [Bdellovibrio sp. KM01]